MQVNRMCVTKVTLMSIRAAIRLSAWLLASFFVWYQLRWMDSMLKHSEKWRKTDIRSDDFFYLPKTHVIKKKKKWRAKMFRLEPSGPHGAELRRQIYKWKYPQDSERGSFPQKHCVRLWPLLPPRSPTSSLSGGAEGSPAERLGGPCREKN